MRYGHSIIIYISSIIIIATLGSGRIIVAKAQVMADSMSQIAANEKNKKRLLGVGVRSKKWVASFGKSEEGSETWRGCEAQTG